jgi:hypothetical protein
MSKPRKFRKHPRLSENDVERACLDLLRLRGYWVIRQQSGLFKTPVSVDKSPLTHCRQ